jgi:hypothetical protein
MNSGLAELARPIEWLKPDPDNAREHGDRNIDAIRDSMTRHGQQRPVVAMPDGTVIAGNGMLKAAIGMGWSHLAALIWQGSKADAIAFGLADNRTAELARWNSEQLGKNLDSMRLAGLSLAGIGWSPSELNGLLPKLPGSESSDGGPPERKTIGLTAEQFAVVKRAIAIVHEREQDDQISDGRALELICADFMGGL